MIEQLTPIEQRVIGVLLEKERTVPDTYPMTLNGVLTGSNQSSGRDPVMSLTEREIEEALGSLRQQNLTRRVLPSHGARTEKYRQVADEVWQLEDGERAVLTLLLLRGPQTPGELKSRSARLHDFADLDDVHAALASLAERDDPFVAQLERRPGHKERRWTHLIGPSGGAMADAGAGPGEPADQDVSAGLGGAVDDNMTAAMEAMTAADIHPDVEVLAPLVGTWKGAGRGDYATVDPFEYQETLQFSPVAGKPMLAYRSTTTAADDGRPLHAEVGWLRVVGPGAVELVVAQAPGLLEAVEGMLDAEGDSCALVMSSSVTAGTTTAKTLSATEREYEVEGDELSYRLSMSAVGQPLAQHLTATLRRVGHPASR